MICCLTRRPSEDRIPPLCWISTVFLVPGNISRAANVGENGMYAVIQTGGKQYRVAEGDTLRVETLPVEEGGSVEIEKVLMVANGDDIKIGTPFVEGGKVTATVKAHGRGEKIKIIKFRRRKHSRSQMGHRQNYTELQITGIAG